MKKIIRVFPRRTAATPDDELVRVATPPGLFDEADEVHVSVTFTWDLAEAEKLVRQWSPVAPVKIGGPATGEAGGEFIPGMYVKQGYVLTSRGCPNRCWFCSVWRREGAEIRELPITEGCNVLDDNLLACSDEHIKAVFAMLKQAKKKFGKAVEFTGGLEAKRLKDWHIEALRELRPKQMFFAYDTPDDLDPLITAGQKLTAAGWNPFRCGESGGRSLRAYVLCGFPQDTFDKATKRMEQTIKAGFMPMAMLYRDTSGRRKEDWMKWQRRWARPAIIASNSAI